MSRVRRNSRPVSACYHAYSSDLYDQRSSMKVCKMRFANEDGGEMLELHNVNCFPEV